VQLKALHNDKTLFAHEAEKETDYICPECFARVRLRRGVFRQPHFFHLSTPQPCRQKGKSLLHITVQADIARLLPKEEALIELRFPSIGRIADVVWPKKRLIFEVQCSPISEKEVRERNRDYQSEGYDVVWLLSSQVFNKKYLSAAEAFLISSPHYYFTSLKGGEVFFYDLEKEISSGEKTNWSDPLPISLHQPKRLEGGKISFAGDLSDLITRGELSLHLKKKKSFSFRESIVGSYLSILRLLQELLAE